MTSKRHVSIGLGVVALVGVVAGAVWFGPWRDDDGAPRLDADHPAAVAVRSFADAWSAGTLGEVAFVEGTGDVAGSTALLTAGLKAEGPGPKVTAGALEAVDGPTDRIRGHLTVTWDLGGGRQWSYATSITTVEVDDRWLLEWNPSVVEPSLRSGEVLRSRTTVGRRGRILDTAGTPLSGAESTVIIGIRKSRAPDPADTARKAAALTGVDLDDLLARLDAAPADQFVEVTRLPRPDYDRIREDIQPLPGTVFQEEFPETAVPANYARAVIGSVGAATAEDAERLGGTVREGDVTGLSGLQASQNAVLGGTVGVSVEAVGSGGTRVLKDFPGSDGKDVTITLDQRVQAAAEEATAGQEHPTSLVAIRASTGDVLAIANGGDAYDRALLGRYPPGSAFKIASTYAYARDAGITPDTVIPCPETITVGKVFRNAEGSAYGEIPFRTDFVKSCNTAFVDLSRRVTPQQLAEVAGLLGYRRLDLGLPMIAASVPVDGDATEHAAQSIGQGRVEANVLHVALSSASIAAGRSVQPRLIVEGDVPPPAGELLDPMIVDAIRSMMRGVVTEGTGTALAEVAGGEVMAKTGTAEFGQETPPETHAWITGYQGDIAFAVVVEGGGFGGAVAGPIAADFLNALARG